MADDLFYSADFFKALSPGQLDILRPYFDLCEFPAESVIFEQGAPAEHLYIVVSGEVVVNFKPDDGSAITVARLFKGEVVGWSAALNSHAYTSSASTATCARLLSVRGQNLRQVCRQHPDIGKLVQDCLAAVIVERVRNTHAQVVALLELGLGVTEKS
jgi:CRP-like cAMP-binding protein